MVDSGGQVQLLLLLLMMIEFGACLWPVARISCSIVSGRARDRTQTNAHDAGWKGGRFMLLFLVIRFRAN